jgi:hypothetical protein
LCSLIGTADNVAKNFKAENISKRQDVQSRFNKNVSTVYRQEIYLTDSLEVY